MLTNVGGDGMINMNNEQSGLGKRIAELRRLRGWTQDDLALRVGMSKRTVGEYERRGPLPDKVGRFDAVFGGELLRGPALETLPLDGMTTNGAEVPAPVRRFIEVLEAVPDAYDKPTDDLAADQDCVTRAVEPLGVLLDEVFARLRAIERSVADLDKRLADR